MSTFRIATRDELWIDGHVVESRVSYGEAVQDAHGIVASDVRDEELVALAERELARLRAVAPRDARVRMVGEASSDRVSGTMTIRRGELSIVTDAEHAQEDDGTYGTYGSHRSYTSHTSHLLWLNGTAAILLHEAFGHPAEHNQPPIDWPAWLTVDLGLRERRATFRDVPLQRMSHVIATQTNAPFEAPDEVTEIHMVAGGSYDPLTQLVTLQIAVPSFELRATRQEIAASLIGAYGDPIRYPGVVCSREGQELVVPSFAPVMLTR